jgi:hypothetical protein
MRHKNINATPLYCPHCGKFVFPPPGWMRLLVALAPVMARRYKLGMTGVNMGTASMISRIMGVSRERIRQLVRQANVHRVLESPFPHSGVYRLTRWGRILLRYWVNAGWVPGKDSGTRQIAMRKKTWAKRKGE